MQLNRLSTVDRPFGTDFCGLDLVNARAACPASHAPNATASPSSASPSNMGTESLHQPSSLVSSSGNGGGAVVTMAGAVGPTGLSPLTTTLRSAATGRTIPMQLDPSARLSQLHDFLRSLFGNAPSSYDVKLNGVLINGDQTLCGQGVIEGSILDLLSHTSAVPF